MSTQDQQRLSLLVWGGSFQSWNSHYSHYFVDPFDKLGFGKILGLHHSENSLHLQTSFFDFTLGSIPPGCFLRKAPTVSMQIYYTPGEEQMNNVDSFIQTGTSSIFRVESKFLFASLKDHSNCKPWPRRSVPPLCHT